MSKPIKKSAHKASKSEHTPAQFTELLNSLPEQERNVIVAEMTSISSSSFSGPLPPPQLMEGYEQVLKGSAERILAMAEAQTQHRIKQENTIVKRSLNQKLLGLIFGGICTIALLLIVYNLAQNGHDWLAGVLGTTTVLGILSIFILGHYPSKNENNESH